MTRVLLVFIALASFAGPAAIAADLRPQLTNNIARPLRYWPVGGDFVITNGGEFFNRPLYCAHSAFRIDGGDKPEFSIYLPGRGGNLRFGIRASGAMKWLNEAGRIVTRYRPGSLIYQIRDPLLGQGELDLAALPLSKAKGLVVRVALRGSSPDANLLFAFGGANGMKGRRGGDIGCEREPVSQFFQLRPPQCAGNTFTIGYTGFTLRSRPATIDGLVTPGAAFALADARYWNDAPALLASEDKPSQTPVLLGSIPITTNQAVYLALIDRSGTAASAPSIPAARARAILPAWYSVAEARRRAIAGEVAVDTPDAFINAAVPALNVAADAIWDSRQSSFMHGAVAWRTRLLGWRGPYAGDALGWHARTAQHLAGFAREQNTSPVPGRIPPADERFNLARNEAALHSNGDLTRSHYDMNLVAVDAFFRHLLWTDDTNFARQMWPTIERHFAWERRLFRREFGPRRLPLYEAYAAIWASDNLGYDGAGTAHASAYNFFENTMAARVAKILGRDPEPYRREAELIRRAMQQYLWLTHEGCFAESKDYLGLQRTHDSPALWTFYTVMDSGIPTASQAWQMARWTDLHLARIPIQISNQTLPAASEAAPFTLPDSNWMPYQWSLNNVVVAEAVHGSLGYWQANRPETAFALFKGALLDTMFLGLCPGNVGAMTGHDAARGEAQRDFGDGIGITARALVEGLFGIRPDALSGNLTVAPGFPSDWAFARMRHPDLDFEFHRDGATETYRIESKFSRPMTLVLQVRARGERIARAEVNGQAAECTAMGDLYGAPRFEIRSAAAPVWNVTLAWEGQAPGRRIPPEISAPVPPIQEPAFDWKTEIPGARYETISLTPYFNDQVTQIFRNEYRSPRSPFCSLATPKQGIGGWAEFNEQFNVDDSGLRAAAARHGGRILLPDGIPFKIPVSAQAKNILFTSQWNNYPQAATVPLSGKSSHLFLLMAGSTGPMQSRFDNGEVRVNYKDGSSRRLLLRNPTNWWPIDQDYFIDDFAFRRPGPIPPRVDLTTGKIRILDVNRFKGKGATVPGGAATVLELPLDKNKELQSLTVRALANEVVVGLMAATLERD